MTGPKISCWTSSFGLLTPATTVGPSKKPPVLPRAPRARGPPRPAGRPRAHDGCELLDAAALARRVRMQGGCAALFDPHAASIDAWSANRPASHRSHRRGAPHAPLKRTPGRARGERVWCVSDCDSWEEAAEKAALELRKQRSGTG